MTTAMGPPPSRNPTSTTSAPPTETSESPSTSSIAPPPPPPPKFTNPPPQEPKTSEERPPSSSSMPSPPLEEKTELQLNAAASESSELDDSTLKKQGHRPSDVSVPYTIPSWSGAPCHQYSLEVLKDGAIIDQFEVNKKGAYMFGRVDLCDFILEHPTISRFHAVIQFKSTGEAFLYDLGSTHGTYVNKNQVKKKAYVELHVGDVVRFGGSTRLYILQGPTDLMPSEADLRNLRSARIQEDMKDMEASLSRAKREASLADGVSWGMQEDAIEEDEEEVDEVTWQNFKGQLTEKQMKTREKVVKRLEKIAHMKKEIDAIRAKDISQGGLTQGQQTQIARNEQRISQILEELENLEETLNESIRESLGARSGKATRGNRGGAAEDGEEDYMSDDDEFYDRTKKPHKKKSDENPAVETADSLLEKKEVILKEMENKQKLLMDEDESVQSKELAEEGDALDAYMSSVSSQLVLDRKAQVQTELTSLQSELDRVLYLLKIADPTGEAAKKRDLKAREPVPNMEIAVSDTLKQPPPVKSQNSRPDSTVNAAGKPKKLLNSPVEKQSIELVTAESGMKLEGSETVTNVNDDSTVVHSDSKQPQWLGALHDVKKEEIKEAPLNMEEKDDFVPYKDRNAILDNSDLESAAPGLIIRKRKQVQSLDSSDAKASEKSKEAEAKVEDTVALLLKHSKAYHISNEMEQPENVPSSKKTRKDKKTQKKVLGPDKPSFLSDEPDYDSWVPPEGQSGDGRTSLNDRYGY